MVEQERFHLLFSCAQPSVGCYLHQEGANNRWLINTRKRMKANQDMIWAHFLFVFFFFPFEKGKRRTKMWAHIVLIAFLSSLTVLSLFLLTVNNWWQESDRSVSTWMMSLVCWLGLQDQKHVPTDIWGSSISRISSQSLLSPSRSLSKNLIFNRQMHLTNDWKWKNSLDRDAFLLPSSIHFLLIFHLISIK